MKDFKLIHDSKGWSVVNKNQTLLTCSKEQGLIGLSHKGKGVYFKTDQVQGDIKNQQLKIEYSQDEWVMKDEIRKIETGLFEVKRQWVNTSDVDKEVILQLDLWTEFHPTYYMIPAVNYNGNKWGNGKEPKGLTKDGKPWVFGYNRVSLPSATFSENKEYSVALFSSLQGDSQSSACSLSEHEPGLQHTLYWPEQEGPYSYTGRDKYSEAIVNTVKVKSKSSFSVTAYLSVNEVEEENFGWTVTFDKVWDSYKIDEEMKHQPEDVWGLGIDFAKSLLEKETENDFSLFNIGYRPNQEGQWQLRDNYKYEIGWCGQHGALATAFIKHYLMYGDKSYLEKGTQVLDFWVQEEQGIQGLLPIAYKKSTEEPSHIADTCNLGWAIRYLLEGYELALEAGMEKPQWKQRGLEICDFFCNHYDANYYFGKSWNIKTGVMQDSGGTIGTFLIMGLLKAYEVTGEEKYLETASKAFKEYSTRDLDNMQCTAGALDTCCIDKETCWPFLKTGLDLYELTGDNYYLKEAKKAAYYLLSWMMHYETVSQDEVSDFKKYGYKTFGGTSVSTQHHHLDPWGGLIANEWMRLGEIIGERKWIERARATWQNALYCIADGKEGVHGMVRPRGAQNEAYFHTHFLFECKNAEADRMNDWLVTWPTAFRLITLMDREDWSCWR